MTTLENPQTDLAPTRIERSLESDYETLRSAAALLDLSDVGLIRLTGEGAHELAQRLFTRDIEFLTPERSITGLLLTEDAHVIDVVSCFVDDRGIVLRTSFGSAERVQAHISAAATEGTVVERLDMALIGVEGPYAWSVIGEVLDPDLASLPFESVVALSWRGHEVVFSRTGVTGEYGYQMFGDPVGIEELRSELSVSAQPIGREAVEIAMLEVRQPLLSEELMDGADVLTAGLQWLVDPTKESFQGKEPLLALFEGGIRRSTIGARLAGLHDSLRGNRVLVGGEEVGEVVWTVPAPGRDHTWVLARVRTELTASGLDLDVETPAGPQPVRTLSSPYVVPTSWGVPIL